MFIEQLDFAGGENNNDNFKTGAFGNLSFDDEVINKMQREKIQTKVDHDFYKEEMLRQQQQEQLDFGVPPTAPSGPQVVSYYTYYHHPEPKKNPRKPKKPLKKPISLIPKKKPKTSKPQTQPQPVIKKAPVKKGEFNVSTNLNNKGLFDPDLKLNELDYVSNTQKQRIARLQKIRDYEKRYGKKVKDMQAYNNILDVYDEYENKRYEYEYNQRVNHPFKFKKEKDELVDMLNNLPKPKIDPALAFNFAQYESTIKELEDQIRNERIMREKDNREFNARMREYQQMKCKRRNKSLPRAYNKSRVKSEYRKYFTAKINPFRIKTKYHRFARSGNKRRLPKDQRPGAIIQSRARQFAKSVEKEILMDIQKMYPPEEEKKNAKSPKKFKLTLNTRALSSDKKSNTMLYPKMDYINPMQGKSSPLLEQLSKGSKKTKTNNTNTTTNFPTNNIMVSDPEQANIENFTVVPYSSLEQNMLNDVLIKEKGTAPNKNNIEIISSVNNSIQQQVGGIPQLNKTVYNAVNKVKRAGVLNNKTTDGLKKYIRLHIDELIPLLVDDMLIELVGELQLIEDFSSRKEQKENFFKFVNMFFSRYKEMEALGKNIMAQLSSKSSLAPYVPVLQPESVEKPKELPFHNIQIYQGNTQLQNMLPSELVEPQPVEESENKKEKKELRLPLPPYSVCLQNQRIKKIENYASEYLDYKKSKGAFYFDNIFQIYDEVVNNLARYIMNEQIDYCINQMDNFVNDLYKEEVCQGKHN